LYVEDWISGKMLSEQVPMDEVEALLAVCLQGSMARRRPAHSRVLRSMGVQRTEISGLRTVQVSSRGVSEALVAAREELDWPDESQIYLTAQRR
jgi:hypothetical protein